ncbi:SRPBCC family protein [Undibacterium flavidum]|uniref:Polyketide cyclase/dehydrase/lipid transport protein n=1 Tax=Undibacterium flavidum TaxID=2762297 RepID=A0ABR6YAH1_9BURK|nr:hypothetical protein [Undibacterium flavidum]MBC3873605.1 hypothetical protein [Undibacterium flavidum]
MNVEVEVSIKASKPAIWAAISDIEHATKIIRGIEKIEIVNKPANGLIGLRWRETRILFGKPATAEKWITDAVENEYYQTRAESDGFIFLSTTRIEEQEGQQGAMRLISVHDSQPQTWMTKLMVIPMRLFFKGVAKKALMQDLIDIKTAVERA